ncbi:uncharacterized protein B0T23DRAFT_8430 [Neurospora hispaniola]|uniref:Uncharacterized protein n=1 Tax=Neurospora hispaniola TaxID=588809 RepID=A0AAJ0IEU9_9PEZI|nr:hypothetical protein B0T23DRAFT_8430 [Neurospora hispaniola]
MATKIAKIVLDNINIISLLSVWSWQQRPSIGTVDFFVFFSNLHYLPCTYILLMRPSLDMPLTSSPSLLSITSHTHALLSLFFFPPMFVCCDRCTRHSSAITSKSTFNILPRR